MRSTESLALLAAGAVIRPAPSVAADSLFLVALCTDTLRECPSACGCCTAISKIQQRRKDSRRACKILMEIGISRDGLDHILDAVNDQTLVNRYGQLIKVRTTSHMERARVGLGSPNRPDAARVAIHNQAVMIYA